MQLLQLSSLGHLLYFIICAIKVLSFTEGQIKVELSIAIQVVMLDMLRNEIIDLILDLFLVLEVYPSEREPSW